MAVDTEQTVAIPRIGEPAPSGPPQGGWVARIIAGGLLLGAVLILLWVIEPLDAGRMATAFSFAIVGISMNVLLGYTGQISLGHQAFYGIGAFTAGFVVTELQLDFILSIPAAAASGAVAALVLGGVALRLGGLLLALVTLTYGAVAERSIFLFRPFTGGGSGMPAPKPMWASNDRAYAYVCLAFLIAVLLLDWRFVRTKAGRAVQAIRDSERVAASMGISVVKYKLLAFVLSGSLAGLAGGLFAHNVESVQASTFDFFLALEFVLMTVVGGLRSRAGVVAGSMFFALLSLYFTSVYDWFLRMLVKVPAVGDSIAEAIQSVVLSPSQLTFAVGSVLLIFTLISFPGGIGQQLRPITNWFAGGRFDLHLIHGEPTATSGGSDVRP